MTLKKGTFIEWVWLLSVLTATGCSGSSSDNINGLSTIAGMGGGSVITAAGTGGTLTANLGGAGSVVAGTGITSKGTGGKAGTAGKSTAGKAGTAGNGSAGKAGTAGKTTGGAGTAGTGVDLGPGSTLPPVTDYAAPGPFKTKTFDGSGPDGAYTMYQPVTLGENGFLHPILTWGNGVTTTPQMYPGLLGNIASHGFVIIASDSTAVNSGLMTAGLDWLIQQNDVSSSEYYKKLDTSRAVSMGYSLGGGGALTTGAHKNVITTIAMHPAPGGGALHGPVLLFTGSADTIVAPAMVDSSFARLTVPTFYANLTGATHMEPVMTGGRELAPSVAWLRLWVYNDTGAKDFFYGDNCKLCVDPWTYQTKNWK